MTTVREYITSSCTTEHLGPLSRQILSVLQSRLPDGRLIDISADVEIVGPTTLPFLQADAADAFSEAVTRFGKKPKLVHALRVLPQQAAVSYWYLHKRCNIPLAAMPGASPHERAIAVDLDDWEDWISPLSRYDWVWRGKADRPHFNFHGRSNPDFGHEGIKAFQALFNEYHGPKDHLTVDGSYGPRTEAALLGAPIGGWK